MSLFDVELEVRYVFRVDAQDSREASESVREVFADLRPTEAEARVVEVRAVAR